jgi:hypothetical protein
MPSPKLLLLAAIVTATACGGDDDGTLAPLYASCTSVAQCAMPADSCITIAWEPGRDGAMCSLYCDAVGVGSPDCPGGGSCWELVGDPVPGTRICYDRCDPDVGCPRPGFTCANAEMEGMVVDYICLPCGSTACP